MKEEFLLQNFYDGLTQATKKQLNAAGKRTFSTLSIQEATTAIEKAIHIDTYGSQKDKICPLMTDEVTESLDSLHTKMRDLTENIKSQFEIVENQVLQLLRTSGKFENVSAVSIGGNDLFMASNLKDPEYLVGFSIYGYLFLQALCDLGASVKIMTKAMLQKLNHPPLYPTLIQLKLANSAIHTLEGVVLNIPVKIFGKEI